MTTSRRRAVLAVTTAAALALGATACGDTAQSAAPSPDIAVQQKLDAITERGIPGAQLVITDPGRGTRVLRAGTGNTATDEPIPDDARARIGSNTKAFIATVIMQLVDEGVVDLGTSVEHYLPGIVAGNGNDGSRVTVRDLLQHTSGLTDYLAPGGAKPEDVRPGQLQVATGEEPMGHYMPAELVKIAMSLSPGPAAKDEAVYSNTNYILLGMLIEKVTGRPAAQEIATRIIDPLGLKDTYFPGSGETQIRGPHAHGYHRIGEQQVDVTEGDVSWADTAGAMVATGADLNTFFTALLRGDLVSQDRLAEMKQTVPFDRGPKDAYGLGLVRVNSSCGKEIWGHGGGIPGFGTSGGVDTNGRAVTLTVNHIPMSADSVDAAQQVVDAAMCAD
ncbi:beta-lactamase family protein [Rhodococcus oryzae]|uniref:Beta-lactamase family protein n=1 Tax=Rhodococcus oryzae TaxID=2571143 RepID=A0ABY2RG87_9NOCA|nr:serine hydrolase domain-containing protein [Rhodococcus oryzae]TJZ75945.1 beta-lactamase family protein [Rhodococcus oryzae]